MTQNKLRLTLIAAFMALVLVVLGVTGGLNIASFKQNYTQSLISSYSVLAGETVRKIEYAVKYGKPLTNFYGMDETLRTIIDDSPAVKQVLVSLPDGSVIYNQNGAVTGQSLSGDLTEKASFADSVEGKTEASVLKDGSYYIFLPIRDKDSVWIGTIGLTFDEQVVTSKTSVYLTKLIVTLLAMAALALLSLLFFVYRVSFLIDKEAGQLRKKRLLALLFVVLGVVQIAYGFINYFMLQNGYLESVKENTSLVLKVVQRDVGNVVDKGVPYSKMYGVGSYMDRIINAVPEVDRISIVNSDFTTQKVDDKIVTSKYAYSVTLANDKEANTSYIAVVDLSRKYIDSKMREILLDTATMVVISFFLMVEITLFVYIIVNRQVRGKEDSETVDTSDRTIVRPLGFLVFAAVYMSVAFIPVLMKSMYTKPLFGLSQDVIIGLPISAEMLCVAISSFLGGYISDKKGWKPVFMLGIAVLAAGTLLSGMATGVIAFILARGLVGIGFGFSLMAMQAYVITAPTETLKNDAINALNAGAYAGINTGVVVGGMLSERIGFSNVFFVAFSLVIIGGLFALKGMANSTVSKGASANAGDTANFGLLRFFRDPQIVMFFMLVLIPMAIAGMFLNYFFPLYAENSGVSPANIGRAYLLNGLCIVYLGPVISTFAEKHLGAKRALVGSGLIVMLAMIIFAWTGSFGAALVSVALLGVAEGFGITAQINYYITRQASVSLGEGKAMGYYGLVENFGQMLGPVMIGTAVAQMGMANGIGLISVLLAGCMALFLVASRQRRQTAVHTDRGIGGDM